MLKLKQRIQQQLPYISYGQMNLLINFRNLWLDLATWTRNYIARVMSGWGGVGEVGERLYEIPVDFYNRLQLIFGEQQSQGFLDLLSQHIILMMTIADSLKKNDTQGVNTGVSQLYQNAIQIASFLERLNPFWNGIQWKSLFDNYINMTLEEMVALASNNFARDIDIYDRIAYHTVFLADFMTNGIIQYASIRGSNQ